MKRRLALLHAEEAARVLVSAAGRALQPFHRLLLALQHALAGKEQQPERVLGVGAALLRRLEIPARRHAVGVGLVVRHAVPEGVQVAEVVLRFGVALQRRAPQPLESRGIVLAQAQPAEVHDADARLRLGVAGLRERQQQAHRLEPVAARMRAQALFERRAGVHAQRKQCGEDGNTRELHARPLRKNRAKALCAALLAAAACGAAAQVGFKTMQEDSRRIAQQFADTLGGELRREMEASGALRSVLICKYYAPEVASALSRQTGWRVSRVSLRPRNPALGYPDPWEQKVLADFDKRVAAGEKAETLEHAEIVQEPQGEVFRYMKALPVGPLCLQCHGDPGQMSPLVKQQLAKEYPLDRGTGYRLGQVRGAVTVKRPL